MIDMILEPCTVRINWRAAKECSPDQWTGLIESFFTILGQKCEKEGNCLIGHIKGLALFEENNYLKVSLTSSKYPPDIQGEISGAARLVEMTVNIIVYGLERASLEKAARESLAEADRAGLFSVEMIPVSKAEHDHKH